MNGLQSIDCRANGMCGDVGSRHRLTSSTGSRARGVILPHVTSGGVRIKRSLAYHGHLEHPGAYPLLESLDCLPGATVVRIRLLKVRQHTHGTINRPDGQHLLVGLFDKLDKPGFLLLE